MTGLNFQSKTMDKLLAIWSDELMAWASTLLLGGDFGGGMTQDGDQNLWARDVRHQHNFVSVLQPHRDWFHEAEAVFSRSGIGIPRAYIG